MGSAVCGASAKLSCRWRKLSKGTRSSQGAGEVASISDETGAQTMFAFKSMWQQAAFFVVVAALPYTGNAAQPTRSADLIVTNGKVHTLDAEHPQATAFAVKDGKFVAV